MWGRTVEDDRNGRRRSRRAGASSPSHGPFNQLRALLFRTRASCPAHIGEDHIASILSFRQARTEVFGPNLFSDPAWDVLLELYGAELGGRSVSLHDLAIASDTPQSATARWIGELGERGLVDTRRDSMDSVTLWISLTPEGSSRMRRLADHWGSAFLSI